MDAEQPRPIRRGLICTDTSDIDYATLVASSRLVVDTRHATRAVADTGGVVVKA